MPIALTSRARGAALALLAFGTLAAEIVFTRLLSVTHLHVLAFLAVSSALLGAGAGARWVAARPRSARRAQRCTLALVAALPLGWCLAQLVGLELAGLSRGPTAWFELLAVYLLLGVPFGLSGAAVAELLESAPRDQVGAAYGADLLGAALGCGGGLAFLALSGPGALWLAAAAIAAALVPLGRPRWGFGLAGLALVLGWVPLPIRIDPSKTTSSGIPWAHVLADSRLTRATHWGPHARVDEVQFRPGLTRLVLDAGAAAVRLPEAGAETRPVPTDATLPYELRPGARVLVVGAGAGYEVAEALAFGASSVVGVEVNPAVLAQVPAPLTQRAEVEWIEDDARGVLERQAPGSLDVVVMVHTISNAAVSAGALGLSEDHLLTKEAFEAVARALAPDGLLLVTRPTAQLPRLAATLAAATPDAEALAWREATGGFYGAILWSPSRLSEEARTRTMARLSARGLIRVHPSPTDPVDAPTSELLSGEPVAHDELRLDPATDDAPFFHRRVRLWGLLDALDGQDSLRMALERRPLAELALLALGAESLLVAVLFLMPIGAGRPPLRTGVAASGIGFGFMLLEVGLVQQLGLLLGRPTLSVAVALGGVLLGAGAGAVWTKAHLRAAGLAAAGTAAAFAGLGGPLLHLALPTPLLVRLNVALTVSIAIGFALGRVLPSLLRSVGPGEAAFVLGLNGVASIAATSAALLLAPELGFSVTALLAAASYALAASLAPGEVRTRPRA